MDSFRNFLLSISPGWALVAVVSAFGIAAAGVKAFESEKTRNRRGEERKRKDLRALADKISHYGRALHQRFPTGDVVVSEQDLAEQLRKRPEVVVTALNLLLNERKVQRAPLSGYWKLNS
jgi:hypothetical protein